MKKTGWIAAGAVLVGLVVAGGWWVGTRGWPVGGPWAAARSAAAGASQPSGRAGEAAAAELVFQAKEVVSPAWLALEDQIEFSGPLVAPASAMVRARAGGTLLELEAAEGTRVRAGQSLGKLDLSELGSRLAERQAMLESARAALAQAERAHAQNENLAAQRFISPAVLDGTRAQLETARAQAAAAEATLASVRAGLRDAALVAPISGIVSKRLVVPGEKLSPEQQVLSIVDLSTLELAGSVGTHEVSRLRPGAAVEVEVEGLAAPVAGRIARIAPAAEPGTRSIGVTVSLANPQERLRAGQYAVARVRLPDATRRRTLPQSAIVTAAGQAQVWVVQAGVLARRAVTLGRRDERRGLVEVLEGLDADAKVLAMRYDNLREGARARVLAAPAPAQAGAASAAAR